MSNNAFCPKIIKRIAKKYEIPKEVIEFIVRSQFRYVAHIIAQGEGEAVRLQYLGRFKIRKWKNLKKRS